MLFRFEFVEAATSHHRRSGSLGIGVTCRASGYIDAQENSCNWGTPERHIIVGMDRSPPSQAESGANEGLKENLRRSPNQRCEC